jgi:glycosyltransferase involved in cell wall biosynthesis
MRIGVDARELAGRATGVGRYLGGLLTEWAREEHALAHEFLLYAPEAAALSLDARRFVTRTVPGSGGTYWEQVTLPNAAAADGLDAWFSPAYSLPLRLRVPAVVAIHDLSFVAHPEWFGVREGLRRRLLCRRSAHAARAVVTISDFSRGELVERLGVSDRKIHVIPPGIDRPKPAASHQPPSPNTAPKVLFVGSIFNRRHVIDLIRAFAPIARARPDASLDIVGDNRSHPHEDVPGAIAAEGLAGQVRWHRYVEDRRLQTLYGAARAFAFLSEYEGLGLTPLEALAAGVPPVLLDTPVARESCGDAALYVPLADRAAITRALELALFSDVVRGEVLAAAPGVLARYDWPRAARATLDVVIGRAAST